MKSNVTFKQDWDNDGYLVISNASTINRYIELNDKRNNTPLKNFDMFCAFSDEQFDEGCKKIRPLKEGEKYVRFGSGIFGTKDGFERWKKFSEEIEQQIKAECEPQEIYLYEYNNHEGCINFDGDLEAIKIIMNTWGLDEARKIKRLRAMYTIQEILEMNR